MTHRTERRGAAASQQPVGEGHADIAEPTAPALAPVEPSGTGAGSGWRARSVGARHTSTQLLQQYSLVALLGVSIAVYALWGKTSGVFLTAPDVRNIVGSQAILVVLTLGLIIPMISGNLDLSIGNAAGLCSIANAAFYSSAHLPLVVGIVLGVLVGTLIGVVNGALVVLLQVDSFIITLGSGSVLLAIVDWYTKGQSIVTGIPQVLLSFGGQNSLGIPNVVYVVIAVALVVWYLLEQTPYGRNIHAIGSNKTAARLVGIRVERSVFTAFVLSGTFAGVAGVLLVARSGAGNPQVGQSFTLTAIAAAFLGAASFKVGQLNVPGSIVAILFLAVNITGLTFAGVDTWISELFTGLSLIVAIAFSTALHRERRHRAPAASTSEPQS